MPLKSDIRSLQETTAASLSEAHDHYIFTTQIWQFVGDQIGRQSRDLTLHNLVTGTRVSGTDLSRVGQTAVENYLPSATIQQFVSLTETFLTDLVRRWITAYPMHLKGQVDVQAIVAAPDKSAILEPIIDSYVLAMGYKRPTDWFRQLQGIVVIQHPDRIEIEQFAEFKATRDVLVHNRGIATAIYIDKAGANARAGVGVPLDLPDVYIRGGWALCQKIVTDVGDAVAAKVRDRDDE